MSTTILTPAPLADAAVEQVIGLMRTTRMPHARAVVAEVLATAKAQRWDPTEVVRVLLQAEAIGRNRSMLATRRKRSGFPTGKTFDVWDESLSTLPVATTSFLRTLEWVRRRENLIACGPSGTGKTLLLESLASKPSMKASPFHGSAWKTSAPSCAATASMTASTKPSPGSPTWT